MDELNVDPKRFEENKGIETGIFVRAKLNGKWGSYDILDLDKQSLKIFLRSRGEKNSWAENVVAVLLGHGNFEEE